MQGQRRAVFLDRDGTLNRDTGYVSRPEDVELIDGAAQGAKALADAGFDLVIVSNQSGIARGFMTAEQADAVDQRLLSLLREHNVVIAGVYRCPHLPDGTVASYAIVCDCRKPKPGMLFQAANDLGLALNESWMVGDGDRDVEAGLAAGCRAIVLSTNGKTPKKEGVYGAKDLRDAARVIAENQ